MGLSTPCQACCIELGHNETLGHGHPKGRTQGGVMTAPLCPKVLCLGLGDCPFPALVPGTVGARDARVAQPAPRRGSAAAAALAMVVALIGKPGARHLGTSSSLHFTAAFFGCWASAPAWN